MQGQGTVMLSSTLPRLLQTHFPTYRSTLSVSPVPTHHPLHLCTAANGPSQPHCPRSSAFLNQAQPTCCGLLAPLKVQCPPHPPRLRCLHLPTSALPPNAAGMFCALATKLLVSFLAKHRLSLEPTVCFLPLLLPLVLLILPSSSPCPPPPASPPPHLLA